MLKTAQIPFSNQLPIEIIDHVVAVFNPCSDGNCGYRAIAVQINRNEDLWVDVRRELLEELETNAGTYTNLFAATAVSVELIRHRLTWFTDGCALFQHWLCSGWEMACLIANTYSRPFVSISKTSSFTVLPLQAPLNRNKPIFLAFVNGNHFISLDLKAECPLPKVSWCWEENAKPTQGFGKKISEPHNSIRIKPARWGCHQHCCRKQ